MKFFNSFKMYLFLIILIAAFNSFGSSDTKLLLQQGKQLFWSGDYNKAKKILNDLIRKDSSIAEAYYFLGYIESRISDQNNKEIPDWTREQAEKVSLNMEKVLQLQPDYKGEIIVLPPREKIMSEWSVLALAFLNKGDIENAKKAFTEAKKRGGLIPEHYEFMKNMLISCPKNALLITAGDMDTFFPLYLQVVEGIRTDITVLNVYLIQKPWFNSFVTKNHPWQIQQVKLFFSIKDNNDIEKIISSYRKPFEISIPKPGYYDANNLIKLNITPISTSKGETNVSIGDIVLLNLLKDNPQRPLCIASTVKYRPFNYRIYHNDTLMDPFEHLEKRGLVDVLTLNPGTISEQISTNYNLLTKEFNYKNIPNSEAINKYEFYVNEIISSFIHTASLMEDQKQLETGRLMFKKLVELIPGIVFLNDKNQRDYILGLAGNNQQ